MSERAVGLDGAVGRRLMDAYRREHLALQHSDQTLAAGPSFDFRSRSIATPRMNIS